METVKMAVESRTVPGKEATRRLRESGRVPGVVYGRGESFPVAFDAAALRHALAHGSHVVLQLHYPGEARNRQHLAVIKELQRHPVSGALLHVDLQEVQRGEEIDAEVTVTLTGNAPGVKSGGLLDQLMREVICHGEPGRMPASLEVDVGSLQIGQHVLLRDLAVPEGCTLQGDPDQVVVTVLAPRVSEEVTPAESPAPAVEVAGE
jgi:large subunit ribosomal protein L25